MTRPAHRLVWSPAFQVVHILFSGLCYRHCPNRFSVSPRMLALNVLRSYGPCLCLTLIRDLHAIYPPAY